MVAEAREIDFNSFVLLSTACNAKPGMKKETDKSGQAIEVVSEEPSFDPQAPVSQSSSSSTYDPYPNKFPQLINSATPSSLHPLESSMSSPARFDFTEPAHRQDGEMYITDSSTTSTYGTYGQCLTQEAAIRRASEIEQQLAEINILSQRLSMNSRTSVDFGPVTEDQLIRDPRELPKTFRSRLSRSQSQALASEQHRAKRQLKLAIRRQMKQQLKKSNRTLPEGITRSATEGDYSMSGSFSDASMSSFFDDRSSAMSSNFFDPRCSSLQDMTNVDMNLSPSFAVDNNNNMKDDFRRESSLAQLASAR